VTEPEAPEVYDPPLIPMSVESVRVADHLGLVTDHFQANALAVLVDRPDAGHALMEVLAPAFDPETSLKAIYLWSAVNVGRR
jgi:hypothetical protein